MSVRVIWHYGPRRSDQGSFEIPDSSGAEPDYEVREDLWHEYERTLALVEQLEERIRAESVPLSEDARMRRGISTQMPLTATTITDDQIRWLLTVVKPNGVGAAMCRIALGEHIEGCAHDPASARVYCIKMFKDSETK